MSARLTDALRRHAAAHPARLALAFQHRRSDYGTLWQHVCRAGQAIAAAGILPGERVVYLGRNSDRYFEALYGAMLAGAVMVPVNWRLAPPEIAAVIADAGARLLFVGPEFHGIVAAMPRAEDARPIAMEGGHPEWPDFAAWRDAEPDAEPARPTDDIAIQLYTSGTTGLPKGVMLRHDNFLAQLDADAMHRIAWNTWQPGDAGLLAMPVSHVSGSGWGIAALHNGAACHIQAQFDIETTLDMIAAEPISKVFLVPAALQMLVRHERAASTDFSHIREMGYGASPMPAALLRECMAVLGCGFVQFYGLTETCGAIVALDPEDHVEGSARLRAAGKALPIVELRVADRAGQALPAGAVGEIETRSAMNMAGYWNRPEETARAFRDGWLRTGDVGCLDADGYVFILDRAKDMIISGGENVYPAEVENALCEHPAVAEVAVIGIPDAQWGETVLAVVVRRPGAVLAEAELIAWSRARLAGFKCPKRVAFGETLPRNASGKLLKRELRAPYWEGRQRQVN